MNYVIDFFYLFLFALVSFSWKSFRWSPLILLLVSLAPFCQMDSFNPCFSLFPFFPLFDFLESSINITFHVGADERIALLGAIQSLFEGSMYTFVFLWTPALSPNDEEIPHGFIFATFMLASMLGSSFASRLLAHSSLRVESYMQIVFIISSASLLIPILTNVSSGLFYDFIFLSVF